MTGAVKRLGKVAMGRLVSEYRINWIFAAERMLPGDEGDAVVEPPTAMHRAALLASPTAKMRGSQNFARAGLAGLVLAEGDRPICVAHFAEGSEYGRHSTWPLGRNEVALVDIATEEAARGRGLATMLIRAATRHYLGLGRSRLIAFIWWSNHPSVRAFTKAGWRRIGLSVEIRLGRHWLTCRIPLR